MLGGMPGAILSCLVLLAVALPAEAGGRTAAAAKRFSTTTPALGPLPPAAVALGPGGQGLAAPRLEGTLTRLAPSLPDADLDAVFAEAQPVWVRRKNTGAPDSWERGVVTERRGTGKKARALLRSWDSTGNSHESSVALDAEYHRSVQGRMETDQDAPPGVRSYAPRSRGRLVPGTRVWVRPKRELYRGVVVEETKVDGRAAVRVRAWGFRTIDGQFEAIDHLVMTDGYWGDKLSLRPEADERVPETGENAAPASRPLLREGDPAWIRSKGSSGFVDWHRGVVAAVDGERGMIDVDFWDQGSSFPHWVRRWVQTIPTWGDRLKPRFEEPR